MNGEYEQGFWGNGGRRLVEELDSDEDSDTQGAGLVSATGRRFSSDPLRFTGIDMGEAMARPRRNHAYEHSDDDSQDDSGEDTELDEEGHPQLSALDNENELVDSAMRRIRRAQASGKQDVKLSKKELAALENRRRRLQVVDNKKKKKKEQRYAVPLSQLAPISQKENRLSQAPVATPSAEMLDRQRVQPPVGWFAHPSSSRPAPSELRRPPSMQSDRESSTSPFQYSYVQHPGPISNPRHTSDPTARPRSARGPAPYEDARMAQYNPSSSVPSIPSTLDPFRYMTAGPYAPYHAGSVPPPRNVSGSSVRNSYYEPSTRGGTSTSRRQSRHFTPDDEESSSEDDDSGDETSDEVDEGAHIGSSNAAASTNEREQIVVEVEREPTPEPRVTRSKKKLASSNTSSPKRKSVASSSSRRKRGSK